jgi:ubiquinol-cytochrome c reductase cytochrome c1 subunit
VNESLLSLGFISILLQLFATLGIVTGGTGALLLALDQSVRASELELHPPKYPWSHRGYFSSLDHSR